MSEKNLAMSEGMKRVVRNLRDREAYIKKDMHELLIDFLLIAKLRVESREMWGSMSLFERYCFLPIGQSARLSQYEKKMEELAGYEKAGIKMQKKVLGSLTDTKAYMLYESRFLDLRDSYALDVLMEIYNIFQKNLEELGFCEMVSRKLPLEVKLPDAFTVIREASVHYDGLNADSSKIPAAGEFKIFAQDLIYKLF